MGDLVAILGAMGILGIITFLFEFFRKKRNNQTNDVPIRPPITPPSIKPQVVTKEQKEQIHEEATNASDSDLIDQFKRNRDNLK